MLLTFEQYYGMLVERKAHCIGMAFIGAVSSGLLFSYITIAVGTMSRNANDVLLKHCDPEFRLKG